MLQEAKKGGSIHKILHHKQFVDFAGIGVAFVIAALVVAYSGLPTNALVFVLVLMFIVSVLILEISRKLFLKSLHEIVANVTNTTSAGIKRVENITNSQKDSINSTVLKLTNVKNVIQNLKEYTVAMNEKAEETHKQTQESLEFSNAENLAVKANIDKMFMIRHKIQTIAELILELSEFIQSISSTIGVVKDIAEQTNLLALNAAVEAARAGEHGKGFAVVAGEIRKLADESKQATSKITSLIMDIQQTTNSTVMATEEGTKEIESGIGLAQSIDKNIEALIALMNEISLSVKGVIGSSGRIASDIMQTNAFLDELDVVLEQNYRVTEENYKNIEDLDNASKSFRESV